MAYMWIKWWHLLMLIAAMGWMVTIAFLLDAHNRAVHQSQAAIERRLLFVGYMMMALLVLSGLLLVLVTPGIMHSDWFYLKLFLLAPLLAQFFHFRGVILERRIEVLGYSKNYFLRHQLIIAVLIGTILFLSLFKPL